MRENRTYGSEGGAAGFNRLFLPLYPTPTPGALLCPAGQTVPDNSSRRVDRVHHLFFLMNSDVNTKDVWHGQTYVKRTPTCLAYELVIGNTADRAETPGTTKILKVLVAAVSGRKRIIIKGCSLSAIFS